MSRFLREYISLLRSPLVLLALLLLNGSCSPTKYVPADRYLLDSYKVKIDNRRIRKEELKSYIKPQPNKKILGFKFYLFMYNLSGRTRDTWLNRSLRTIGEEPVLFDEFQAGKTTRQLELYLRNKGFYDCEVNDTVLIRNRKAKVIYDIDEKIPYRIGNITYSVEDTALTAYFYRDSTQSLLKRGALFDADVLSAERERIELILKNKGYYKFSKEEYLFFEADSSRLPRIVDVRVVLKNFRETDAYGSVTEMPHPIYRIRNVFINTNYKPQEALTDSSEYVSGLDTLRTDSFNIIYPGYRNIKPNIVANSTFIIPGENYNLNNVNLTYRHLSSLEVFRLVNIEFMENQDQKGQTERFLDCSIQLTPFLLQSFTIEPEVTNSSGNIGGGGNLVYQHKNLFTGAENFNFSIKAAVEALKKTQSNDLGNLLELGAETNLKIPKFILPFRTDQFIRQFNPKTSVKAAYNYQQRPEYTRTVANMSFGYIWKGNRNLTHNLNPFEVNLVRIPQMSSEFSEWLEGKYIAFSYQPHLIALTSYNLTFSNQRIQSFRDFVYVKYNVESAGSLLYFLYDLTEAPTKNGVYELFNTPFAQYVRSDIDLRYYNVLDENTSVVYRFFAGLGVPFNNSTALPFEKKYFSGGANSIRAWQVRDLGPGSFEELNPGLYPNKTADIKLEANLEYRFKLFWLLKGALFLDVGNIWAINDKDERPGAVFKWDTFYKDIAIGTGMGLRFDFSFFIFRLDLGIKLKDPVYPEGERWWFLDNRHLARKDFVFNFGIGYPF